MSVMGAGRSWQVMSGVNINQFAPKSLKLPNVQEA